MKIDTLPYLFHYIVLIGGLLAIIGLLISYGFPDVFLPSADKPPGTIVITPSSPLLK